VKFLLGALAALALLAAAFFTVPMLEGGTSNICQATDKYRVSKTAASVAGGNSGPVFGTLNSIGQMVATGEISGDEAANRHPNLPAPVGCALVFWQNL
jgi:hypothetical protein